MRQTKHPNAQHNSDTVKKGRSKAARLCDWERPVRDPLLRSPPRTCIRPATHGCAFLPALFVPPQCVLRPHKPMRDTHRGTNVTCRRAGAKRSGSDACSACSGGGEDHGAIRGVCRRGKIEDLDPL